MIKVDDGIRRPDLLLEFLPRYHLAGPMKAGVIAALDADRDALMLREADVALVGDWRETLPALVDALAR